MSSTSRHIEYDIARMAADAAEKGWNKAMWAEAAGLLPITVSRFLRGLSQTPQNAKALADALGYPVARYIRVTGSTAERRSGDERRAKERRDADRRKRERRKANDRRTKAELAA